MHTTKPLLLCAALFCAPALAQDTVATSQTGIATLLADDGEQLTVEQPISFAIVGNTRRPVRALDVPAGRTAPAKGVPDTIFADIAASRPDAVVLLGDQVRKGVPGEYKRLDNAFQDANLFENARVIPVAGNHEYIRDEKLNAWAQAFPGVGADIGFNRVASWYAFQIKTPQHRYRFVVLDSGKKRMGSRWDEQLSWLPSALEGRYDSLIVVMHDALYDLSGRAPHNMNNEGAPSELIEEIEQYVEPQKFRALISAGGHTNQVLLPDGPFSPLYLVAGGGGAPGQDLSRWNADEIDALPGTTLSLDPLFDVSILKSLDDWSETNPIPQNLLDQAQATGSFEGFVGIVDAKAMPTYGWYAMTLEEEGIGLTFRHRLPNGTIEDRHKMRYTTDSGWVSAF